MSNRSGGAALVAGILALGLAAPARAQVPTLTGESFSASAPFYPVVIDAQCDVNGVSVVHFEAQGVAFGPYPGTFVERGTARLGPHERVDIVSTGTSLQAPVLSIQVEFAIYSALGEVHGTKTVEMNAPEGYEVGHCQPSFVNEIIGNGVTGSGKIIQVFTTRACYEATIQSATGTSHDSGSAYLGVIDYDIVNSYGTRIAFKSVEEGFTSDPTRNCGGPALATSVTLSPATAVNVVGTQHTVTATATSASGAAVAGVQIDFQTSGSTSATGSCTTGADGTCTFTYQGPLFPGADVITGCADQDGVPGPDAAPCGTATKQWVLPASTLGHTTGGGQCDAAASIPAIRFGVEAKSDDRGLLGSCTVNTVATSGVEVKCTDVIAYVQAGTHAFFYGNARVNGVATLYRIDVDDFSEPNVADTFVIHTASGFVAGGPVTRGNVQVR